MIPLRGLGAGVLRRFKMVCTIEAIRILYRHRELLWSLTIRDLKGRFSGSMLGFYWAILHPFMLISIYLIVFTFVFKVRLGGENSGFEYALFAGTGLVPWLGFVEAASRSNTALTSQANLVKRVIFPIEILPAQVILSSLITQLVGITIVSLIALFVAKKLSLMVILLPFTVLMQAIFCLGLAWFLASINVFFRDTKEIVQALLTVGLFVTPILYSEVMVPPSLALLLAFNPITHLIHMYRDVLFYGQMLHPWSFGIFSMLATLFFLGGYTFFVKTKIVFSDLL
ncbi:MAG: ABC transporter permease [Candidatus Methanomethylicaceae archaeon]